MEQTNEYFTLATLGKFYTDAAKSDGIEALIHGIWHDSNGPSILSKVANYRLYWVSVRYMVKLPNGGMATNQAWDCKADAVAWLARRNNCGKVVKLVEEV